MSETNSRLVPDERAPSLALNPNTIPSAASTQNSMYDTQLQATPDVTLLPNVPTTINGSDNIPSLPPSHTHTHPPAHNPAHTHYTTNL